MATTGASLLREFVMRLDLMSPAVFEVSTRKTMLPASKLEASYSKTHEAFVFVAAVQAPLLILYQKPETEDRGSMLVPE